MNKLSSLKIAVQYTNTPYVIIDRGIEKSSRFELWNKDTEEIISKSNDPYKFDSTVFASNITADHPQEFTLTDSGDLW